MPSRLRVWLLSAVRTRTRAAVSVALLVALALGAWYGARVLLFRRDQLAGREALERYDFPEARRKLAACLRRWPDDPPALLLAAEAARRDGLLDEAQGLLDRHYDNSERTTPEAALQWILLRVQRGQVKDHVATLLEYLEIRHPQSEQIFEALAQGCVHVYNLREAAFWTKQLLDRYPHNPVGRLLQAQALETLGKGEQAAEIAGKLVEDYPHNDKARTYLAGLLAKLRRYDEAAEQYRELRRRQPGELTPLLGLARVRMAQDRLDDAEPLVAELREKHGDDSEALLACARFELRRDRPAEAEPLLRRALELAPNDHEVHHELGICLERLGRTEESRRHLERFREIEADLMALEKAALAMSKNPSDLKPRREAGRLCLRNGQTAEGLRWLAGVLEQAPDDKATHQILADYYAAHGDPERAAYHRRKATP